MGNTSTQIEEESPAQVEVTLLGPEQEKEEKDTQLDPILRRLDIFLCFFGFHQSSLLGFLLSWVAFLLLGVSIPVVILRLSSCYDCEKHQIYNFRLDIIVSRSCLAAVSLGCVSHNLRKYGIREFLFVDRLHGQMLRFRQEYTEKIQGFFRLLLFWILPCFLLKTACEIIRISYAYHAIWWQSVAMLLASVISWVYLITISLSAFLLFNLVCNLQVIHFENYGKLLERDSDVSAFIDEHLRLRLHLSKISHRFRIFLLLAFLVVTASQFVTLFRAMASRRIIGFINGCDFAVFTIVQVVGIILCLNAAIKISHRAQGVVSVVSRWHALLTCNSTDASELRVSSSAGSLEAMNPSGSLPMNYSESDLELLDYLAPPINTQPVSFMSTYHKRQAFVTYLQSNPSGITIFGWTVDRALISTIFFLEFTLVLFVLGNTLGLTAN